MLAAAGWAAVAAVVVTAGSFTAAGLLLAHRTRLAVAVLLLLVALAIGAWLVVGLRLAFTVAVAVLEPQHGWTGSGRTIGLFAALGRSWRLTRGRAWRTFGIVTLTGLTVGFGGGLLSVLTQVLSVQARPASVLSVLDSNARALTVELAAVEGAVQVLAGLATAMLVQIVATLAYADARIRDEGLARSVLDHLGTGVPASPWVSTATEHPPLAPPWGPTAWAPTPPWGAG